MTEILSKIDEILAEPPTMANSPRLLRVLSEAREALLRARKDALEEASVACEVEARRKDDRESPQGSFIRLAILEAQAQRIRSLAGEITPIPQPKSEDP